MPKINVSDFYTGDINKTFLCDTPYFTEELINDLLQNDDIFYYTKKDIEEFVSYPISNLDIEENLDSYILNYKEDVKLIIYHFLMKEDFILLFDSEQSSALYLGKKEDFDYFSYKGIEYIIKN